MEYGIEIIKKEQLQTSLWSGGTTTQLAIYPKDAVYSQRNFIWRLSSAQVEAEESVFTSLPGISRIIMIIEGELLLEHEGHYKKVLKRFDQDSFSGSWTTKSYGKVVDFNLMMREGCEGDLEAIHLDGEATKAVDFQNKKGFFRCVQAMYCVNGEVSIKAAGEDKNIIHKGDIILIKAKDCECGSSDFEISNIKSDRADLILARIYC